MSCVHVGVVGENLISHGMGGVKPLNVHFKGNGPNIWFVTLSNSKCQFELRDSICNKCFHRFCYGLRKTFVLYIPTNISVLSWYKYNRY